MFKKLQFKLTLVCTGITGVILIAMTCICLYFSQSNQIKNAETAFSNNLSSMLTHLEGQSTISLQWIVKMEKNHQFLLSIYDNGQALFYQELRRSPKEREVFAQAAAKAKDSYGLDLNAPGNSVLLSRHTEFKLKTPEGTEYFASGILLPKKSGHLSIIVLQPLETQKKQLSAQRWQFAGADAAAVLLLGIFFWFFMGKLLRPLEENRRQQAGFIASASHELRSPLAVILSCLTASQNVSPEESRHFTEIIRTEGKRMSHLIDEMLQLANADSHSWNLHFAPAAIDTLVLTVYEKYELLAREKSLDLTVRLPDEEVPPILCDEERVSQILSIFMDNAISYTPPGGKICLSLCCTGHKVHLSVADNGPGIPNEEKKRIFQRFYRRDQARTCKEHFGLGLSIAKEIIRLHKGKLLVTDTPGGGATFTVIL